MKRTTCFLSARQYLQSRHSAGTLDDYLGKKFIHSRRHACCRMTDDVLSELQGLRLLYLRINLRSFLQDMMVYGNLVRTHLFVKGHECTIQDVSRTFREPQVRHLVLDLMIVPDYLELHVSSSP
jgi:hypothetical protein